MKRIAPNKKGFTLVEEVVSVVLIGILILSASGIMMSTLRIFTRNVITLNAQEKGIAVMNQLEERIKYASEVGSATDETGSVQPYKTLIYIDDQKLKADVSYRQFSTGDYTKIPGNVLCDLGNYDVEYTVKKKDADNIIVDLKVKRDGTAYYSDKRTIKLLNSSAVKLADSTVLDQSVQLFIGSLE